MRALIVYYSRTGNTKKVGDELAKVLQGNVEEVIDTANRAGPIGFMKSGREGMQKMLTKIQPVKTDPTAYDMVVIGTPNWAASMSSPIRTYLTENKEKFKSVAFFCTEGVRGGSEKIFADMETVTGKKPKATLKLNMADLKDVSWPEKVKKFAGEINA